jgi:hypothetical protein
MYQLKWGERKHISQNVRGGGGFLKELEGRDFGSCTVAFARGLVLGNRLPRPNPQPAAAFNDLLRGRIARFLLDTLVNISAALGRKVTVRLDDAA